METHVLIQVFGILLILFYFFVAFMCWKTWHPAHVIFTFLVFASSIAFAVFASLSLKNQMEWRQVHQEVEGLLEEKLEEGVLLAHGNLLEVHQTEPSARSAKAELGRALFDRGRVWRQCTPRNVEQDGTLTVETLPPNVLPGEDPPPHGIDPKLLLYVFQEADTGDGWQVPVAYLGEFEVTGVTDVNVTLSPTLPLEEDQQAQIQQREGTWAMYETMPVDGHEPFADTPPDDEHLFGQVDEQRLRELMPNWLDLPPEKYEAMLQRYLRNGQRARDDDPPENVWLKVRFVQKHEVQVDSEGLQATLEGGYFDPTGRATVPRLRRGEPAAFDVGDQGVFDRETAEQWIADGLCELIEPIYVRKLNDYALHFHEGFSRNETLTEAIRGVQRNTADLQQAKENVDHQIRYREQEKTHLQEDLAQFQYEREQITQYAQALNAKWVELRSELSQLYRSNQALAEQLANLHKKLTDEIDQRTDEATASLQ